MIAGRLEHTVHQAMFVKTAQRTVETFRAGIKLQCLGSIVNGDDVTSLEALCNTVKPGLDIKIYLRRLAVAQMNVMLLDVVSQARRRRRSNGPAELALVADVDVVLTELAAR